jgi:dihydrofolate synthase/folylpolyglutamate synthase
MLDGCRNAMATTGLSGRWQVLAETPLTVADGGHNPHGMTEIVRQLNAGGYERLYMVLGFSADKELDDILPLLPGAAYYLFTQAASPRALPAAELAAKAERYGLHGETLPEAAAALARARALASPHDMIFIGGSFYLIGEII